MDGEVHERSGYTVVAANSAFYGFGRHIAPDAAVDDGLLDVVVIKDAPRRLFFAVMNELKDGTPRPPPGGGDAARAARSASRPTAELPYGADGEVEGALPVTARVLPGALDILY